MTKSRSFASAIILMIWLITACVPVAAPAPAATTAMAPVPAAPTGTPPAATPTLAPATVTPTLTALPGALLPVRGLVAQFERRGASEGYWMGEMLQLFDTRDDLVGHTVREEVALQLDEMVKMGVNTIRYELRSASPASYPDSFVPPYCTVPAKLGLQYPQPTQLELKNLVAFFDLVHSKGVSVDLELINIHMEEQPPYSNTRWIGSILNAVKDRPALDLVTFDGGPFRHDTNGDGKGDQCGGLGEAPLWDGPDSLAANYVQWAIQYGHSLGIPYRKLSSEAIVGDYYSFNQAPGGAEMTDRHHWDPVFTLKSIFDNLNIPNAERTYALSWYEHPKCMTARELPCTEIGPHAWAIETANDIFNTIGRDNGARVVATEMGMMNDLYQAWTTEKALESLVWIMHTHGIDGGCFWQWVNINTSWDFSPRVSETITMRGKKFIYNPIADVMKQLYTQGTVVDPHFDPEAEATAIAVTLEAQK